MKRASVAIPLLSFLSAACLGQSGAVIPEHGAGHASQASCIILKRMGPADEVTSHLYSFGIRGKQFQYVEGKLPDGFPFHGRLTDHDVRNLQARGAEVTVLEPHYTPDDLRQARADCRGETGATPNQSEAKAAPLPPAAQAVAGPQPGKAGTTQATATVAPSPLVPVTGKLSIASVPDGADIEIDGSFVGNTPSEVQVPEGDHTIAIKKLGFKEWERKLKVSGGSSVHLSADLEKASNLN
ncbi:MAG: PEGA domain-containing protein [Candidatus Sulfotelmatobacter sp.]